MTTGVAEAGPAPVLAGQTLLVRSETMLADGVISLELVSPEGAPLPPWQPGAHIDITLPSGSLRQYSLCGDPADRDRYQIAVLHEPRGRGGSAEIHSTLLVGQRLRVRGPRNRFPLVPAERYLFVAGGIGITPIRAMAEQVERDRRDWRLFYGGRSRGSMAFRDELVQLAPDRVTLTPEDEFGLIDLDRALKDADERTAVYCCGPEPLLVAVVERCAQRGLDEAVHLERFAGDGQVELIEPGSTTAFTVELRRSGQVLQVAADQTILDRVCEVVPGVPFDCREGYCGACETAVLDGIPEHHDTVLSSQEKEESRTMMICVGRSVSPVLVLDL